MEPAAALSQPSSGKPLLDVCRGKILSRPPVWLMRQAGRYLPEYQAIRAQSASFLDFCYNPLTASEATLQPIRRFGFDAAILFSDILVIPDALGQKVRFEQGEGPRLEPIKDLEDFLRLRETIDLAVLAPVFETVERVAKALPDNTAFIGFCGAPWTVASYMIAGRGTPDQAPARLFAYRHRALFQKLIDRLVAASVDYLSRQFEAGVELVQIFDSWAGVLPQSEYEAWCLAPIRAIVEGVRKRHPKALIIGFPRGIGTRLDNFVKTTGVDVLGLDSSAELGFAARLDPRIVLQGNLDPLALLAGGAALEQGVAAILSELQGRPFIFNLGHGILPATPIAHVERLLTLLRT